MSPLIVIVFWSWNLFYWLPWPQKCTCWYQICHYRYSRSKDMGLKYGRRPFKKKSAYI